MHDTIRVVYTYMWEMNQSSHTYIKVRSCVNVDTTLKATDIICKSCYDMHLAILQHIQEVQQVADQGTKLKYDITIWKHVTKDENTNELTRAVLATVLSVSDKVLQGRTVLLPRLFQSFLRFIVTQGQSPMISAWN